MFTIPTDCCEKKHTAPSVVFDIDFGALSRTADTLKTAGIQGKILLVADSNTWQAAGAQVAKVLKAPDFLVIKKIFPKLESADMETAHTLAQLAKEQWVDAILAVGTGTINDLCRYAAFLTHKPYAVVGTAASMDGFCSGVAPLIENGFKRTYNAVTPCAVIGDGAVLDKAPSALTAAGLGDLLGKYTCLADWKIAHLLTGEYFCPGIEQMVRTAVDDAVAAVPAIQAGTKGAALPLMRALCLSGIAMALSGNSRPASGAEHHLSHFWEMRFLMEGRKQIFHGTKVGVATVVIADIYHRLGEISDISSYITTPPVLTQEYLAPAYGVLSGDILHDNAADPLREISAEKLISCWQEIRAIINEIPDAQKIASLIKSLSGPVTTQEIGIDTTLKEQGVTFGRYVRSRLTLLRISDLLSLRFV